MSSKLWDKYWKSIKAKEFTITADYSRKKEREILLKFNKAGIKIAEVGSGSAFGSLCFANQGNKIYAIDFSQNALNKAKHIYELNNKSDSIVSVLADIKNMPFKNNTFDVVWNQGVLEHFDGPKEIVDEMIRITKKNEVIVVFVPNKYCWQNLYYKMSRIFKFLPWPFGEQDFFSYKELIKFFDKDKGKIIRVTGVVPFMPPIPIRNKFLKKILKIVLFSPFEIFEDKLKNKTKAKFGRQVCIIYRKN